MKNIKIKEIIIIFNLLFYNIKCKEFYNIKCKDAIKLIL